MTASFLLGDVGSTPAPAAALPSDVSELVSLRRNADPAIKPGILATLQANQREKSDVYREKERNSA